MSLLSLPDDILLHIVTLVGLEETTDLATLALVCKPLYHLVYDQQSPWRAVFLAQYDDPRLACAFPSGRVDYDWRQRVICRHFLLDVVRQYQPTEGDVFSEFARMSLEQRDELSPFVYATLVDMYNDLPSLGAPSLNVPIMKRLTTWKEFGPMQSHMNLGSEVPVTPHLRVVLWRKRASQQGRNYFQGWIDFFGVIRRKTREGDPWANDLTDWGDIAAAIALSQSHRGNPLSAPRLGDPLSHLDHSFARGIGIRDLHRPAHLPSFAVWDWADVSGSWYELHTRPILATEAVCGRKSGTFPAHPPSTEDQPVRFALVPVSDNNALASAYHAKFGKDTPVSDSATYAHDITSDHAVLPRAHLDPNSVLPPLYFYGCSDNTETTAPPKFLSGVVYLTRDDPPQLRWDIVIESPSAQTLLRFQGVQPGGRCSPRGVFGLYKLYERTGDPGTPRLSKPRDPTMMRAIEDGSRIPYFDGVMRLFKPWIETAESTETMGSA